MTVFETFLSICSNHLESIPHRSIPKMFWDVISSRKSSFHVRTTVPYGFTVSANRREDNLTKYFVKDLAVIGRSLL